MSVWVVPLKNEKIYVGQYEQNDMSQMGLLKRVWEQERDVVATTERDVKFYFWHQRIQRKSSDFGALSTQFSNCFKYDHCGWWSHYINFELLSTESGWTPEREIVTKQSEE